jgi:hypothetical protein
MKRIMTAALACGTILGVTTTAGAAGMNNGWDSITITQEQCVTAAATAVERTGFAMQRDANGAWGFRPNDGITVRCIAQRQLVVFFVHVGQADGAAARALLDQLRAAFTAAAPARTGGTPAPSR